MQIYARNGNVTNAYINVNVFSYRLSLNNNAPNENSGFKKTGYVTFKHIRWL